MPGPKRSTPTIFLSGFMGSGKSSLGPMLSKKLPGYSCLDTDDLIMEREGTGYHALGDLIEDRGMGTFRNLEYQVVREAAAQASQAVVALGGGAFNKKTAPFLLGQGPRHLLVVWLRVDIDLCLKRIQVSQKRPLLKRPLAQLKQLYKEREVYYRKAHLVVDIEEANSLERAQDLVLEGLASFCE